MGDTSHPQQHQPQPVADTRTTRQEQVEPNSTTTTATATPSTHRTITPRHTSRKDALLSHKHGRSNNNQGQVAPLSNTSTLTTTPTTATGGNNNNNNKRHNHTVTTSKTRPIMRSVSNQSQQYQDQKQQHNSTTTTAAAATMATTKSERRPRTSSEQHHRRRRPKFVCGDHADEELSSDQQHQQQLTHSHGAATASGPTGEVGEGGRGGVEEEEGGGEEAERDLKRDGYHPYHSPRHKHDAYPVSPSRHHISPHQDHHPQPTEVARGSSGGLDSQAVSSQQGNLDLERGPNSGSIPNNSQRPHPLPRPSSTSPAPLQAKEKEQQELKKKQPDIAAIRLTAPETMIATPASTTTTTTAKTKANLHSSSPSPSSSSEESAVSVTRAKLTNFTLVGKDEQQQRQHGQEGDSTSKDTALVGKDKGGFSEEESHDNKRETTKMTQLKDPEVVVRNSSTSSTSTPNTAAPAEAGGHHQSTQQHPYPAPAAGITTSPFQRPSKRLTRLLNPSLSTTSLPSLSKTTSQPVVAIVNLHHIDSLVDDANATSNHHKKDSSPSQQDQQPSLTAAPATSAAVDLVSKLLNPAATLGRSQSQSSLHSMFTNALSGSPSSTSSAPGQHRRRHARHGSAASLAGSVKSNPGSSTGVMGFMTSPPRAPDPNAYLISRFITPASQQQAALSSSTPKQHAGSLSNGGNGGSGSLAARRRLPASLRMTSSDMNVNGRGPSIAATASGMTPTSSDAESAYSSTESPTLSHSHSATPPPLPHSSPPFTITSSSNPWSPAEAMSRTQQKLNLQRDSAHDDLDEQEMARRDRVHREMERIQREYKCIRMTSDPVLESMSRCFTLQTQQQESGEVMGGGHGDEFRSF